MVDFRTLNTQKNHYHKH